MMDLNYWTVLSSIRRIGDGVKMLNGGYLFLASLEYRFIKVHENLCNIRVILYRFILSMETRMTTFEAVNKKKVTFL